MLGSYRLVQRLGRGGMGDVWRAEHVTLGRPAAVKLVRADVLGEGDARARVLERFRREARATAALQSVNSVTVHDLGETADDGLWFAMELLDGLDCDSLVANHGPQPPARVVHLLAQACDALHEAHGLGLVHRDIKPANLLVCRKAPTPDCCKLLDFGLALPLLADRDSRLTGDGAIAGTPAWIAPEAALAKGEIDHRADIYGLGCVAYWLLCGKPLFETDHPLELVMAHVRDMPVAPGLRAGIEVPAALEAVVMACLAKAPADRPPSALALKALLLAAPIEPWTALDAQTWWAHVASEAPDLASDVVDQPTEDSMPAPIIQPVAPAQRQAPIASQERDHVQAILRERFAHSVLDLQQFEHRAERAAQTPDRAELAALIADLAPLPPAAIPSTNLATAPVRLTAVFSGIERKGAWHPPQQSVIRCLFGGAELDFREAVLPPGPTVIEANCLFGGVDIRVPAGLPVVVEGSGFFGGFASKDCCTDKPSDPSQPWLKITGTVVFGGVHVRGPKRRLLR